MPWACRHGKRSQHAPQTQTIKADTYTWRPTGEQLAFATMTEQPVFATVTGFSMEPTIDLLRSLLEGKAHNSASMISCRPSRMIARMHTNANGVSHMFVVFKGPGLDFDVFKRINQTAMQIIPILCTNANGFRTWLLSSKGRGLILMFQKNKPNGNANYTDICE